MTEKTHDNRIPRAVTIGIALVALILAGLTAWYIAARNDDTVDSLPAQQTSQNTSQPAPDTSQPRELVRGTFVGAAPKTGSGSVVMAKTAENKYVLRLQDDFMVQDGPDLYVGFGDNDTVDASTLFAELKAFEGAQEYDIPDTVDPLKYSQVFIYCKEFSVTFSAAVLR